MSGARRAAVRALSSVLLLLAAVACGGPENGDDSAAAVPSASARELPPPPSGPGAMAPFLAVDGDDLLLSWLEPSHRLLVSRLSDGAWSSPASIAEGDDFFANWADVPKVAVAGDGTLWAHWLAKLGEDTYAYGVFLARSDDGGATWEPRGLLHDDRTPTEHGFVAYAPEGSGLRAVWLDGRAMLEGGPMALRTALLAEEPGASEVLDDRVCECCPPELVAPAAGAVAFYRDRSPVEVRDVAVTRVETGGWSEPEALATDGWRIPGCPVNGPAADASADRLAVAWFTAADDRPRVQVAFSSDGGASFDEPLVLDDEKPLGRVDLVLGAGDAAWVSWLGLSGEAAALQVARVDRSGVLERRTLATTGASRASGIPRLARVGGELYAAWVATVEGSEPTLRVARLAAG